VRAKNVALKPTIDALSPEEGKGTRTFGGRGPFAAMGHEEGGERGGGGRRGGGGVRI